MNETTYSLIPVSYMREGMERWIEHGIRGGSFMMALLENDLQNAVGNADGQNLAALQAWVRWLYNYAPFACWGSKEKVEAWEERKGMKGGEDAPQDETA